MREIFSIDNEKCLRCGACADVCPLSLIEVPKGETPVNVSWARKICINCGHCACVCPGGALSLNKMPLESCKSISKDLTVSSEQAEQFLRSRRSIRVYRDTSVEKEKLEKAIELARYAPTGHNLQPVIWKVLYSTEAVSSVRDLALDWMRKEAEAKTELAVRMRFENMLMACDAGADILLRGAPHLVVAYAQEADRTGYPSSMIALTYLDLAVQPAGLGVCWAGILDIVLARDEATQKALGLPEGHKSCGSMMIGYPKYRYNRMPARNEADVSFS